MTLQESKQRFEAKGFKYESNTRLGYAMQRGTNIVTIQPNPTMPTRYMYADHALGICIGGLSFREIMQLAINPPVKAN